MELFDAINYSKDDDDFIELKCTKCGRFTKININTCARIVCACERKERGS